MLDAPTCRDKLYLGSISITCALTPQAFFIDVGALWISSVCLGPARRLRNMLESHFQMGLQYTYSLLPQFHPSLA